MLELIVLELLKERDLFMKLISMALEVAACIHDANESTKSDELNSEFSEIGEDQRGSGTGGIAKNIHERNERPNNGR